MKANGPTSRKIGATNTIKHGRIYLDTHAKTIVSGQSFILLSETGREFDVFPYTNEYEVIKNIPIVLEATSWTSLELAETFIIFLHEGLWMNTTMDHTAAVRKTQAIWTNCEGKRQECQEALWNVGHSHKSDEN